MKLTGVEGNRVRAEIRLDPVRDLFVALVASPTMAEARAGGVTVRCFAPAGRHEAAVRAAQAGVRALQDFSRRFGPYPFSSLVLAAIPLASYGLEFPGIVALSERIFDLSASIDGIRVSMLLESTVAHEIAHQWFYGLVGNDQVKEPWLDESLAQYATYLYFLDTAGRARASGFAASFESRWDRVGRSPTPIGLPVESYTQKEYGAIVYGRGPLFIQALAQSLGDSAFDAMLREWVRRYNGKMATTRDFMQLASETAGRTMNTLFTEWVLEAPLR